jgi:hypothetical protein
MSARQISKVPLMLKSLLTISQSKRITRKGSGYSSQGELVIFIVLYYKSCCRANPFQIQRKNYNRFLTTSFLYGSEI